MDKRFNLEAQLRPNRKSEFRRTSPRHREFLVGALIITHDGKPPLHCVVHDKSSGGARLELERLTRSSSYASAAIPNYVTLYYCPTKTEVDCHIAWRDGQHLGVEFITRERVSRLAHTLIER